MQSPNQTFLVFLKTFTLFTIIIEVHKEEKGEEKGRKKTVSVNLYESVICQDYSASSTVHKGSLK